MVDRFMTAMGHSLNPLCSSKSCVARRQPKVKGGPVAAETAVGYTDTDLRQSEALVKLIEVAIARREGLLRKSADYRPPPGVTVHMGKLLQAEDLDKALAEEASALGSMTVSSENRADMTELLNGNEYLPSTHAAPKPEVAALPKVGSLTGIGLENGLAAPKTHVVDKTPVPEKAYSYTYEDVSVQDGRDTADGYSYTYSEGGKGDGSQYECAPPAALTAPPPPRSLRRGAHGATSCGASHRYEYVYADAPGGGDGKYEYEYYCAAAPHSPE